MPEGKTNDWVQGPKKFPFVKYAPYPFKQSKFREKETKRVTDHIEKVSAFWASQEAGYEAQRAAKKERLRIQQANGFNLPWDEIVVKERAEKGAIWFLMKNSFYDSLMFNQQISVPSRAGPSFNTGYEVTKSFVDKNEEKEAAESK